MPESRLDLLTQLLDNLHQSASRLVSSSEQLRRLISAQKTLSKTSLDLLPKNSTAYSDFINNMDRVSEFFALAVQAELRSQKGLKETGSMGRFCLDLQLISNK